MWFVLLLFFVQHSFWLMSKFCDWIDQLDPEYVPGMVRDITDFCYQLNSDLIDLSQNMDSKMHAEIHRLNALFERANARN